MENLKIKLNSESEAEEVKRLAVKAGYTLDALFGKKWSAEFCYLLLCEDMSAGFGNEIMADGDKPLSIGELRAMVNPMKEYLDANRNYEFVLSNEKDDGFIKIPDGAECLTKCKDHNGDEWLLFWKGDYKFCVGHDKEWFYFESGVGEYLNDWCGLAKVIWQREQDEPFLTPECTLNEQYAEIEQVRQAISKSWGSVGAASGGVDATLAERQSTYGCFEDVAFVTENIMSILAKVRVNGLDDLPNTHRMALYMIASKMARIVNGDFNHLDSWHDIGGYSKLIEKLIKGE